MAQQKKSLDDLRQATHCLKLEDLELIRKLGSGQFGVVYLVRHDSDYYALKCV